MARPGTGGTLRRDRDGAAAGGRGQGPAAVPAPAVRTAYDGAARTGDTEEASARRGLPRRPVVKPWLSALSRGSVEFGRTAGRELTALLDGSPARIVRVPLPGPIARESTARVPGT